MTGSGDINPTPSDVLARAKAALEGVTDAPWNQNGRNGVHTERGSCIATTHQPEPFARRMADAEFIAAARSLVPELVAELEQVQQWHSSQADKLERVLALAEKWRYKGEFGWGAWQEGHGPDETGYALDSAASELRAALGVQP